jgi:mannose-1-phosphate guanylyltransferase/mannose-6-phosphate isomerase
MLDRMNKTHEITLMARTTPVARQWGFYTVIARGERWRTKILIVEPGKQTSLQRHMHRREFWTVVEGTAEIKHHSPVLIGDRILRENDTADIAPQEWHQIKNPGSIPLVMVETWTGEHLDEDDIERKVV